MTRLTLKPGVVLLTIRTGLGAILAALAHAAEVWSVDLELSCGNEGHGPDDPHTRGEAADLSIEGWDADQIASRLGWLRTTLGPAYTVLYECPRTPLLAPSLATVNPAATAPHFHCQVKIGVTV